MAVPPKWLEMMPDGPRKARAEKRFYMKLASLYASENGSLSALANLLDLNYQTLRSQIRHIPLQNGIKPRIHRIVGHKIIPPHVV